ncbi:MAG: SPOR domain-containing protein [Bacteroidetes bacterium]|nr:SPOR domain-containing protein [Bacteroidota bacterium]
MDAEKLFENIQSGTGKNPTDIALVLDALITSVIEKTRSGQPVDFAEFGSFSFSEYSRIEFAANSDFAKIINYRYNNSRPIVVEDGILPSETSEATLQSGQIIPTLAEVYPTEEPAETTEQDAPSILTGVESDFASPFLESQSEVKASPEIYSTETESIQEVFSSEPGLSTVFAESEPEIALSQEKTTEESSPFIGEPEQIFLPEDSTTDFAGVVTEPNEIPVYSQQETQPEEPGSATGYTQPPVEAAPSVPQPSFSWNEPEATGTTEPAETQGTEQPAGKNADGSTGFQYQYLSHTELNKEMDKLWIWVLIGLGVIALGGFVYWFMQGDVKKLKKAQQVQTASDLKDSIAQESLVNKVLETVNKDSVAALSGATSEVPVPAPATGEKSVVVPASPASKVPVPAVVTPKENSTPTSAKPVPVQKTESKPVVSPATKTTVPVKPDVKKDTKPAEQAKPAVSAGSADGLKGTYDEAKGGFTLNVASVPSADQAQKAVNSWKAKGYASGYKESVVNGKTIFRVRVGQFPTRAAAIAGQAAFKAEVKDAWVDKIK